MKTIIAGGRKYRLTFRDIERLNALTITEVVSGGVLGLDQDVIVWARRHRIPVREFHCGRGITNIVRRSREMADYAGPDGQCVLFPGMSVTDSVRAEAQRVGMVIHEFTQRGHNLKPNRDGTYPPRRE